MNVLLRAIGIRIRDRIKQRIRNGEIMPATTGKRSGRTLFTRGHLSRSIAYRVEGNQIIISAGNAAVPYAKIQHFGGVIRPKKAKYLAIPLNNKAKMFKPKDFPEPTFIAKGTIFSKENNKIVPQYRLVKEVTLPARPYMVVTPADMTDIDWLIRDYLSNVINKTNKGK